MNKRKSIILVMLVLSILFAQTLTAQENNKELTLKDAIFHALKNNLDLQVQMTSTQSALKDKTIQKALYIPFFSLSYTRGKTSAPSDGILDGIYDEDGLSKSESNNLTFALRQQLPFGGNLELALVNRKMDNNSVFSSYKPRLTSIGQIQWTQPLLKNFGLTAKNQQIYIASNNLKIAKHQLRQQIINLVFNVEQAYWNLVFAHQNLQATKMALKRATDLLQQNEIKVRVGSAAPIEILSSKAEVARNESALIQAEQRIQTSEENLKKILNMSKENFTLLPTDKPKVKPIELDSEKFLNEALANRPDIIQAQLNLKNSNIGLKVSKNNLLPELNLSAQLYTTGAGGQEYTFLKSPLDPTFDPDTDRATKNPYIGFNDAMSEVFKMLYKNSNVTLSLNLPLFPKSELAQVAKSKLDLKAKTLALKNVENTIFSEVKEVIKELETNKKLVEADQIALKLEGQKLKAEEKRLAVGIATNFTVKEFQRDYAAAETQALQSVINYNLTMAKINRILARTFQVYDIKFKDFLEE